MRRVGSDAPFFIALCLLGGVYLLLIVLLLLADAAYTTPANLWEALRSPEILFAARLSLISCTITAILSLLVAVPLGYLLSRFSFRGKALLDALLDIPIVLPPLVIGLSLLILFNKHFGATPPVTAPRALDQWIRDLFARHAAGIRLPFVFHVPGSVTVTLAPASAGHSLEDWLNAHFGFHVTYWKASVILAQFAVAAAFAVRTMRVTFDAIDPRSEQVALTLGCTRRQAFIRVVLPEARRGMLTAATLAWARALGEFGPLLIFSGLNPLRTEVLSLRVWAELSIGRTEAAVAVSLLMIAAAVAVLLVIRFLGSERSAGLKGGRRGAG